MHAYYDRFPENSYPLKTKIIWSGNSPEFEFYIDSNCIEISKEQRRLIRRHMVKLNLFEWYSKRAGEEFSTAFDLPVEGVTFEIMKRQIEKKISRSRGAFGPLSWQAALWLAVLGDDKALNHIYKA